MIIFERKGNSFLIYTIFDLFCNVKEKKNKCYQWLVPPPPSRNSRDLSIWISNAWSSSIPCLSLTHICSIDNTPSIVSWIVHYFFIYSYSSSSSSTSTSKQLMSIIFINKNKRIKITRENLTERSLFFDSIKKHGKLLSKISAYTLRLCK